MWKNHISSRNTTPLPRPPPGLTNPKPSSPWSSTAPRSVRGWGTQDSRLASGEKDLPKGASLFQPEGLMFTQMLKTQWTQRKSRLSGRGKSISWVENWSQHKAEGPKNSRGTDGVKMRTLGGQRCLANKAQERIGSRSRRRELAIQWQDEGGQSEAEGEDGV